MLPSTQRPIPLERREDLRVRVIDYLGVGYYVVKDPVGLQYHRLQPEQYHVLSLLDGNRHLDEIRDDVQKEFPTLGLNLADVQHLITDLHQKGLVLSNRPGQGVTLIKQKKKKRKDKFLKLFRSLFYLKLPGWDPEPTLQWMYPLVRWMFHPWAVAAWFLVVLSSGALLATQFETFRANLPEFQQFFGWPNLVYLWVTLAIAKVTHEFGHGLTCRHFGGECHEMGLLFLVFSPCLYCDVTDSWMMKNKWHRIMIAAAGMYIELFISAIALFVWWNTAPGLLHHLALNIYFVTTVSTIIFNANPLLRFDGYYMMADWLEIPNLRPKSNKLLTEKFAWYCLGIESRPDPFMPETGRAWFIVYAIAAWCYRWVILLSISLFMVTVLKPYGLQAIGVSLLVVSMGGIFASMFMNMYKVISAPRIEPMSVPKITFSLSILVAVIVMALAIPMPWHIESAFLIEPWNVHHVYTTTPGQLDELNVDAGDRVNKDEKLAELTNPEKEDRERALETQAAVQQIEIDVYHALGDVGQEQLALEKLQSIKEQLKDYRNQLAQLTVHAPCDGVVIAPPRTPEPKRSGSPSLPSGWFGTPMDPKNAGCFLEERTHLLSIAPSDRLQAIVLVDQGDRNDMYVDQDVELKFQHLPDRTYKGKIADISKRYLEYAPGQLSNKLGGELATVTDSQGRERLQSIVYQATVLLESDAKLLKPGMRGQTRFSVDWRSAGDWLWRYIRRTFHFRL